MVIGTDNIFSMEVSRIKQYRNEWKYCCTVNDMAVIENRLSAILERDIHSGENGKYQIHSLYFDDYTDNAVRENEAGISQRTKFRIRFYGDRYDVMRLERKGKFDGRCHKTSCPISRDIYQKIMDQRAEEVFWQTDDSLLQQFCIRCMTGNLRPKAVVDYERTAYVEETANLRITLDENISVSDDTGHFTEGDYIRYPVQPEGQHVLEVKFDYLLPGYIRHMMEGQNLIPCAFSKYSLGRMQLQNMGR